MPVGLLGVAAKAAVVGSVALTPAHAHANHEVTVKAGDTLSAIAAEHHVPGGWSSVFAANHSKIKDPNLIYPNQRFTLPDHAMTAAKTTANVTSSAPVHSGRDADQAACTPNCPWGDGDGDSMDMDHSPFHNESAPVASSGESEASAPVTHHYSHHHSSGSSSVGGTYHGSGSMQQCIISRESGGNSQVMNSSGHYGLYQFSEATWVASGGSASSFGHASVSEQNQVFANAVAARGYSDWTPYDGC